MLLLGAAVTGPGLAATPDSGSLLEYKAAVRAEGDTRWRAVELSEAGMLAAIGRGKSLRLVSPEGRELRFEYLRHAEHADGSWTWVGRLGDQRGLEAVITIGSTAAFGNIPQGPGRPGLRLTTRDGNHWLVEGGTPARAAEEDALVPMPGNLAGQTRPVAGGQAANASLDTATQVDLLVGYTPGLVDYYGSEAAALTRLDFLVEYGNQSHANSQTGIQLNLVHAMLVDYPDNTANGSSGALEALSPGNDSSTDPAFNALHAARETYGADLVSLVRKYNYPENGSCGTAWVIGGGQQPIEPYLQFLADNYGFSVVSDGIDYINESSYSYCEDQSFVHELGHNMGQAHNPESSGSAGAHAYSYGHRGDAANGNFITVMAYHAGSEAVYNIFSDPTSTFCAGYPCGVADQRDNARSLRETGPLIAQFRAATVDTTPPTIVATTDKTPTASGWFRTNVKVSWTCEDNPGGSGVVSCPSPQSFKDETGPTGVLTPRYVISDHAGNQSEPSNRIRVKIDKTKPTISSAPTTAPNAHGWYTGNVTIHYTCADALSGIASCPSNTIIKKRGANIQTPGGKATDKAGNALTGESLTLNIDSNKPKISAITFSGPLVVGAEVTASAVAEDPQSGIASSVCDPVDTSKAKKRNLTCTVTNGAGLVATKKVSYTVTAE